MAKIDLLIVNDLLVRVILALGLKDAAEVIYMLGEPDDVYLHVMTRDVQHDDFGVAPGGPSQKIFVIRSPNCSQPRGMLEKNQIPTTRARAR